MMSNFIYNYEEWLSGHANRKTMMQKLERSLIPYEIFEAIGLQNDKQERSGEVCLDGNTVGYDSGNTRIVSARSYMMRLPMKTMERRLVEKRMLTLMSLLHNEHLDWHMSRIEWVVMDPPIENGRKKEGKPSKKKAKKVGNQGLP